MGVCVYRSGLSLSTEVVRLLGEAIDLLHAAQKHLSGEGNESSLRKSGEAAGEPDLTHIDPDVVRSVREGLWQYWGSQSGDGFYRGNSLVIDLKSVEGRAQMLVLANLLGARATDSVAEETFLALGEAGLLEWERLTAGSSEDRKRALEILRTTYRAVADKQQKVEAIYRNQALLAYKWSGDLNNLYAEQKQNGALLIAELQNFGHIRQRAYWLVREMKVAGVWPDVDPTVTAYYDVHVRRTLSRFGLIRSDESFGPRAASLEECEAVVNRWFGGDVLPLYLHGSRLCIHADRNVCAGSCPVKENCSFWREEAEQSLLDSSD